MKYPVYNNLRTADDLSIFEFTSVGRNGSIVKRVEFTPMDIRDFYNLAFGDVDSNGHIDDLTISANGDRDKVLATIACIVDIYLSKYPARWVYFSGSTQERTRLYRMAIAANFDELSLIYEVYIVGTAGIMPFQKNIAAVGLLVKKKIN